MAFNESSTPMPQRWYWPGFAQFGRTMARDLTDWLFTDPAYPFSRDPAAWPTNGVVRMTTMQLQFAGTASPAVGMTASLSQTQDLDLFGGRNYIIFARMSEAATTSAAVAQNLITYKEYLTNGTLLVDTQPLTTCCGSGERPYYLPVPDKVFGTQKRKVTVVNGPTTLNFVTIGYQVAFLDSGR